MEDQQGRSPDHQIQTDEKIPKTGNSERSEGHNDELGYQTPTTPDTNTGRSELATGLRYYNYQRNSIFETMVEDIVTSLVVPSSPAGNILDYIIFKEEVPVTTCLVLATGLPSSGKTTALEDTFRELIKLKERAKWTFEEYLSRKRNKKCLSVYELCILGGAPRDQFAWSFATNRYGAVFSILHVLARRYSFHKQLKSMNEQPADKSFFDDHVQWLITQVNLQLERIEANEPEKFYLIQDGLSLINVMDIGVNKALYEFLQTMVSSCRRHVRLAFFSLDRDAPNLDKIPDLPHDCYKDRRDDAIMLKQKPRVDYLLHFATLGYKKDQQDSATVMIATERKSSQTVSTSESLEPAKRAILERAKSQGVDQYLKAWETVNTNNMEQVKDIGMKIQSLIKNRYYSKVNIPLRWIMLRSLVTSLERGESKEIIMRKEFIVKQAKNFKMDQEEVEKFLSTFTDFGSIFYMPQFESLRDIVIVDIWEFAQCLDKLFYPDPKASHAENLLKYGIISLQSIKKILPPEILNDFLTILTTIAMIAEVKSQQSSILIDQVQLQSGVYYYLPSARTGKSDTARNENDFIFLQIKGASFPSSLQAGISNEIMKDEEVVLVATEDCNTSQFLFKSSNDSLIEINIEMIYKDGKTQLRVKNNLSDASQFTAAVNACSKALTATFKCLQRMAKTLRGMKYLIAIPCCSPRSSDSECHYLYRAHKSNLCDDCSKDVPENKFRFCWSKASKKCEFLPHYYDMSINESWLKRPFNVREYGEEEIKHRSLRTRTI